MNRDLNISNKLLQHSKNFYCNMMGPRRRLRRARRQPRALPLPELPWPPSHAPPSGTAAVELSRSPSCAAHRRPGPRRMGGEWNGGGRSGMVGRASDGLNVISLAFLQKKKIRRCSPGLAFARKKPRWDGLNPIHSLLWTASLILHIYPGRH